ncbi:MAG: [Clostridia bacterium]|nr:[FeFe] hydrogenase H-cluster maturation GTPase HydF [Clostridia bacterium]
MSLNEMPSAQRTHIGFFGCRNAGKSSLVNAVTGQAMSIVSDVKGTTTDPVSKAMELLPLGPVVVIDTPGLDDEGELGALRVKRAQDMLNRTDIAVLVVDATRGIQTEDERLLALTEEKNLPCVIAWNKADLPGALPPIQGAMAVSALTGLNVRAFKETLAGVAPRRTERRLVGDLVNTGDAVVLVCPVDESAPKGRIILPQQQAIRDLLDAGALALVTKETELRAALDRLSAPPALVVTDSQAFRIVSATVPDEIPLTSFSILMARYKGFLRTAVEGVSAVDRLKDGDRVLMAEGCTHHRQCNDIGTVKIPRWLRDYTKKDIVIETCSGQAFPDDLTPYALVIHCGGCMLTETVVTYRMNLAVKQGVPFTNYGIVIARMTGALERSLRLFPDLHEMIAGDAR